MDSSVSDSSSMEDGVEHGTTMPARKQIKRKAKVAASDLIAKHGKKKLCEDRQDGHISDSSDGEKEYRPPIEDIRPTLVMPSSTTREPGKLY